MDVKTKTTESNVTLQILSTVDSTGKNKGARKYQCHNVTSIVRNGRFVRPDHRCAITTRYFTHEVDFYRFRSKCSSNSERWVVQRRCGRSLSLSRSIAFSFDREFCLNPTVYLLFCDLNLISIHDSGRSIVWAKGLKTLKILAPDTSWLGASRRGAPVRDVWTFWMTFLQFT